MPQVLNAVLPAYFNMENIDKKRIVFYELLCKQSIF